MKLTVKLSTTLRDYVAGLRAETGLQVEMRKEAPWPSWRNIWVCRRKT